MQIKKKKSLTCSFTLICSSLDDGKYMNYVLKKFLDKKIKGLLFDDGNKQLGIFLFCFSQFAEYFKAHLSF